MATEMSQICHRDVYRDVTEMSTEMATEMSTETGDYKIRSFDMHKKANSANACQFHIVLKGHLRDLTRKEAIIG